MKKILPLKRTGFFLSLMIICFLASVLATGCSSSGTADDATESAAVRSGSIDSSDLLSEDDEEADAAFELHVLDVGQGLCVLIESDGYYMLYDGGGRAYSSYVVAYLKQNGIDTLDYLVASHYDEDHINGLVGVLNTATVKTALTPDYTTDSDIYLSFRSMLESNGASEIHPTAGDTFTLGSAEIQVVSPADYFYDDENDNSIAMRIVYGDFSCILTGDAGTEAEEDMIASGYTLDSDLYVVGHHGSAYSSSEAFVNSVSPDYAVISAGAGNSYGHPTEEALSLLKSSGAELYRTDVQGEIICCTDGTDCRFNVDSADNWLAGSELSSAETGSESSSSDTVYFSTASAGEDSEPQEYVLNTNTMKFHYPDCSSVSQMNDANKEIVTESRDTLIREGYDPCGRCHP